MQSTRDQIKNAKTKMELYGIAGELNNDPRFIAVDKVTFMAFLGLEEARAYTLDMLNKIEGE